MPASSPYFGADWSVKAPVEPEPQGPKILPKGSVIAIPQYVDGNVIEHEVTLDEDVSEEEFQKIANEKFPRTIGDVFDQIQKSTTPVSREEYDAVKQEGLLGKGNEDKRSAIQQSYDALTAGTGGLLRGVGSTAVNALSLIKDTIDLPFSSNEEDAAKNKQD
jgi:hypothetical protein